MLLYSYRNDIIINMKAEIIFDNDDNLNPIDLYDIALGMFSTKIPSDITENYDVATSVELLVDALFEEKEFRKVEELIGVLSKFHPDLYKDSVYILLPNLIDYYLYKGNYNNAELLMYELSEYPEQDFLLFVHLLNMFSAYGQVDAMSKIALKTITSATTLDNDEKEVLESFIVSVTPDINDNKLIEIREAFICYLILNNVSEITSEDIIDSITDYLTRKFTDKYPDKLLFEIETFRSFIAEIMDLEYLDTYEYAGSVLWGSVFFNDFIYEKKYINEQQYNSNLEIIKRTKAFYLVNIPWDGYWKLRFIHRWSKPVGIDKSEFIAEKKLFTNNIDLKPKDIFGKNIKDIFSSYFDDISYSKYLEKEVESFEKRITAMDNIEFGVDKKKDSIFPYLNYLSGELSDELKPKPKDDI